jgi:hypothetical protein
MLAAWIFAAAAVRTYSFRSEKFYSFAWQAFNTWNTYIYTYISYLVSVFMYISYFVIASPLANELSVTNWLLCTRYSRTRFLFFFILLPFWHILTFLFIFSHFRFLQNKTINSDGDQQRVVELWKYFAQTSEVIPFTNNTNKRTNKNKARIQQQQHHNNTGSVLETVARDESIARSFNDFLVSSVCSMRRQLGCCRGHQSPLLLRAG